MTINEISTYIDRVLERAKAEKTEKSLDELLYEVYITVANHYKSKMPKSMLDVFTSKSKSFKRFLDNIMNNYEKEMQYAQGNEKSLDIKVKDLHDQIDKIEAKKISVGFEGFSSEVQKELKRKEGENAKAKKDSMINLLNLLVNEESKKDPEKLNEALLFAYKTQAVHRYSAFGIDESIHKLFLEKYPPFEEYLKAYNEEEREQELRTQYSKSYSDYLNAQAKRMEAQGRIISVYDDTTKKDNNSKTESYPSSYSSFNQRDEDPCCHFYGSGPRC